MGVQGALGSGGPTLWQVPRQAPPPPHLLSPFSFPAAPGGGEEAAGRFWSLLRWRWGGDGMAQHGPSVGRAGVDRRQGQRQAPEPGLPRINTAEGEQTAEGAALSQWKAEITKCQPANRPSLPSRNPSVDSRSQDRQRGPDAAHTAGATSPMTHGGRRQSGCLGQRDVHTRALLLTPPLRPLHRRRGPAVTSGQERGQGDTPAPCMPASSWLGHGRFVGPDPLGVRGCGPPSDLRQPPVAFSWGGCQGSRLDVF